MKKRHSNGKLNLYKDLLNLLPIGAAFIGVHGSILSWNRKASELFKTKKQNVMGTSLTNLFSSHEKEKVKNFISQSFIPSKNTRKKIFKLDSENLRFIQITASLVKRETVCSGLLIVFEDVTKKVTEEKKRKSVEKALKEKEEQYRHLVEMAPDMIYSVSKDKKFTSLNPAFEEITGWKATDWIGKPFMETIHPDDIPISIEKFREGLFGKESRRYELRILAKNGEYVTLEFNSKPKIENGKIVGKFGIGRDITERKELERKKDEFISVTTHELKTPLTTIKAFAQILKKRSEQIQDKKSLLYIHKMDTYIDRLTYLVKDLLDASKINAGRLSLMLEEFSLCDLIKEIVDDLSETTDKHQIIINCAKTSKIIADKHRIGQVLTNLLSNAIKYSPYPSQIIIKCVEHKKMSTISVRDFGIGISKENWGKVFDRFVQIKELEKEALPSLGLGLYISAEIVKRHEGNIWLKSEKGKGSTFFFTLPIGSDKLTVNS